jgi:TRAP-type C4-dicarboxylate transport system permease small subunit
LFKAVRTVLYWFSIVSMALMLVIIFISVCTRYIAHFTFDWAEELARYLFVWATFLGSALIMGENGHLAVELLSNKFKGRPFGVFLEAFVKLCSFVFVILIGVQGLKMTTMMMFQTSPGLNIPMGLVYAVIPLSSVLMLMYLTRDTFAFVKRGGKPVESPVKGVEE